MAAPRIGISPDFETPTDKRGQPSPRYVLQEAYVRAVVAAGGEPLILPYLGSPVVPGIVDLLDGVIISGGACDVPPSMYGETAHQKLGALLPERTRFEAALLEAALGRELPILGVCGGMQLLNVVMGGSLFQDLSLRPGTGTHEQPQARSLPHHGVQIAPSTKLLALVGKSEIGVNSTHHQAVKELAPSLRASAFAPDGVVEALEDPSRRFVLGVQWHPETLETEDALAPYRGLVEAAKTRR